MIRSTWGLLVRLKLAVQFHQIIAQSRFTKFPMMLSMVQSYNMDCKLFVARFPPVLRPFCMILTWPFVCAARVAQTGPCRPSHPAQLGAFRTPGQVSIPGCFPHLLKSHFSAVLPAAPVVHTRPMSCALLRTLKPGNCVLLPRRVVWCHYVCTSFSTAPSLTLLTCDRCTRPHTVNFGMQSGQDSVTRLMALAFMTRCCHIEHKHKRYHEVHLLSACGTLLPTSEEVQLACTICNSLRVAACLKHAMLQSMVA